MIDLVIRRDDNNKRNIIFDGSLFQIRVEKSEQEGKWSIATTTTTAAAATTTTTTPTRCICLDVFEDKRVK